MIERLTGHKQPYVRASELAAYWSVSSKLIYKQINAGVLPAIRVGPRLVRISRAAAIRFEESAKMNRQTAAPRNERS